ncbi:MAG: hypothetical protein JRJ00_10635 [Deltaproteobacteria bacterium]|nr:hypothetical protein [Deltaproteobacteria bacterium]
MSIDDCVDEFSLDANIIKIVYELSGHNYGFIELDESTSEIWKYGDLPDREEAGRILCGKIYFDGDHNVSMEVHDTQFRNELYRLTDKYRQLFPASEWAIMEIRMCEDFVQLYEERLKGRTIEVQTLTQETGRHEWRVKQFKVANIDYSPGDVNGPTFYDEKGNSYHTHPDYGVRVLD